MIRNGKSESKILTSYFIDAMPLDTKDVFFVVSGSDCNVGEKERHDVYQPPPEQLPADITSVSVSYR